MSAAVFTASVALFVCASGVVGRSSVLSKRQALDPDLLPNTKWLDAVIAVQFEDPSMISNMDMLMRSIEAQLDMQSQTCLRFYFVDELETQHQTLDFLEGTDRCQTPIGRSTFWLQPLFVAQRWSTKEDVEHEIMHALGFAHTQNRPDAQHFVNVNTSVIPLYYVNRFEPWQNVTSYGIPYEYGSSLHYDAYRLSRSASVPSLVAVDALHQETMGSATGLTFYDYKLINAHYKCFGDCENHTHTAVCKNGGYPNPAWCSKCVCPTTYAGNCEEKDDNVVELEADTDFQILSKVYTNESLSDEWSFDYFWIKVDPSLSIEVIVQASAAFSACKPGCTDGGIELRAATDKAAVGYRFCCNEKLPRSIVASGPVLPVIFFNRAAQGTFSMKYRQMYTEGRCDTKYDLFVDTEGLLPIVQSLFSACLRNRYVAPLGEPELSACEMVGHRMMAVLKQKNITLDDKLRAVKSVFDVYTDSGNIPSRVNFTMTAIIDGWGTFDQLLRCPVTAPPTVLPISSTESSTQLTTSTTQSSTQSTSSTKRPGGNCNELPKTFYAATNGGQSLVTIFETGCRAAFVGEYWDCWRWARRLSDVRARKFSNDAARIRGTVNVLNSYRWARNTVARERFLAATQVGVWGTLAQILNC